MPGAMSYEARYAAVVYPLSQCGITALPNMASLPCPLWHHCFAQYGIVCPIWHRAPVPALQVLLEFIDQGAEVYSVEFKEQSSPLAALRSGTHIRQRCAQAPILGSAVLRNL